MTYEQFWHYYTEMKGQVDDFLRDRAKHVLASGAVDLASWPDDYQLPKIVLCNALHECAEQYSPLSKEGKDTLKNIGHF